MSGLAKGLAVLEAFGGESPHLTISEAAAATRQSRATARRCLLTLTDLGFLRFDGKYFYPTPRVLRLGAVYAETAPLPQLAQPHLAGAREQVNESVSLAVLDGDESLFVARSEPRLIVSTGVRVGARLPLYASATGLVLLAGLPVDRLRDYLDRTDLKALTAHTPTSAVEIEDRVTHARETGAAISDEELQIGLRAVAVPVVDSKGHTVATMSISAPPTRISLASLRDDVLPVLRRHAEALGRQL